MPTITIYLSNELFDRVRDGPSKIVRAALEYYFKHEDHSKRSPAQLERQLPDEDPAGAEPAGESE